MSPVQTHYEQLLGAVYTWMAGGFEAAVARNRQLLAALGQANWPRGVAVDLGCGSGFQSIPLAEAGYNVIGLDLCAPLIAELRAHAGTLPVRAICDDLANFPAYLDAGAALIVCMGDTLTHLPSIEAVQALCSAAAPHLAPNGRLVLGFRDLATHELKGALRFIPVRQEPDRIFTCFLDYHPAFVEVNDLLYEQKAGQWKFSASSYHKLRLSAAQVTDWVASSGLRVEHSSTEQGLVRIVARKAN